MTGTGLRLRIAGGTPTRHQGYLERAQTGRVKAATPNRRWAAFPQDLQGRLDTAVGCRHARAHEPGIAFD